MSFFFIRLLPQHGFREPGVRGDLATVDVVEAISVSRIDRSEHGAMLIDIEAPSLMTTQCRHRLERQTAA